MAKYKPHHYAKVETQQEEIGAYMSTPVISIDCNATIQELSEQMGAKNVGSMLVLEKGDYVGIVTERDISQKVIGKNLDSKTTKVSSIMSTSIFSLEGNRPITEANQFMAEHKVRHLAVTDEGKIVGMLSVKDLVSFFANPRLRH